MLNHDFAGEPNHTRIPRPTAIVCIVAVIVTVVLILTSVSRLRPGDLPFVALPLSPYLAIGLIAGVLRSNRIASSVLFAIAVLLALGGVALFARDGYLYHVVPEHRMTQRMTVLIVPLLQWVAVLLVILVLLLKWAFARIHTLR